MRYVGLVIGLGLVGAGLFLLVTGLQQVLDFPLGNCFGADCFDLDAAFFTLPASIFALVIGGLILTFSMGAIRSKNPAAFGGISGLSGLGALFALMAAAFVVVTVTTDSIVGGTFTLLAVTFGLTAGVLLAIDQWLAARRRRANRLRSAGMRGTATILGVTDSNVTVNQNPMINMRLRVTIANHPPYEVTKRQVISRLAVGQFVPGATLPVLVDPANPTDVMIDDQPGMGAAGVGAGAAAGLAGAGLAGAGARWTGMAGGDASGTVVRLGTADAGSELDPSAAFAQVGVSPDLMDTIGDALQRAADQFSSGQFGTTPFGALNTTSITVNGRTFQVPGGSGQTIVISPDGQVITQAAGASPVPAVGAAGTTAVPAVSAPAVGASEPPAEIRSAGATSATGTANGRVSLETITDTGTELGDMRLYSFELTVQPAGGAPYKMSHAALVPSAQVPRLIRGASFPAIIDANLPGGLGIFWDR